MYVGSAATTAPPVGCLMGKLRDETGDLLTPNTGKPRGTRHRATQAMLALLDGEAEALTRKAVQLALEGGGAALRLCLERTAPPRRDAQVGGVKQIRTRLCLPYP